MWNIRSQLSKFSFGWPSQEEHPVRTLSLLQFSSNDSVTSRLGWSQAVKWSQESRKQFCFKGFWSGRWESNCILNLKVLCFDGVAARLQSQLEPNGAKS